jgi:hypothetical protein
MPCLNNFSSLYTLIFALFGKTDGMMTALLKMEEMKNAGVNFGLDVVTAEPPMRKDCFKVPIPCGLLSRFDTQFYATNQRPDSKIYISERSRASPPFCRSSTSLMTPETDSTAVTNTTSAPLTSSRTKTQRKIQLAIPPCHILTFSSQT